MTGSAWSQEDSKKRVCKGGGSRKDGLSGWAHSWVNLRVTGICQISNADTHTEVSANSAGLQMVCFPGWKVQSGLLEGVSRRPTYRNYLSY